VTKAEWRRSTQSRRPTPTPGIRRLHPARDHRFLAMRLKEAPPAVLRLLAAPSGSKIRRMLGQVTRPTARLLVAVGRASGLPGAITMAHGYGVTVGSKGKLPLDHSLRRDPGGCNVRAVHDFRHHIQEDHGRQDKGAHVFVPPASGNTGNWRPGWRSSSGDRSGQQPAQQQYSSGQQRWSQGSADQQPPATVNTPPPRRR